MDPKVLAQIAQMFRANKLGDPSSAAFDPVLGLLTGTYTPKAQFTEEQLFQRLAPTMLYAAAEGPNSPRAIAASRIKAGESPWSIEKDKELRGNIPSKEWSRFVADLAKESQAVRAKMLDIDMEQDPFEKQGLRGLDAQFTPQDAYKYAPKEFAKIFEGMDEAQKAEDARLADVRRRFGGDVIIRDRKQMLKTLTNRLISDPEIQKDALKGGRMDRILSSIVTGSYAGGLPSLNLSGRDSKDKKAKKLSDDERKIVRAFAEQRAEKMLKENPLMSIVDVGQTAAQKSYLAQKEAVEARTAGTASNKMAQAAKLAEGITGALTSAGLTPTMEDILRNLAVRKTMK
jgi:hypothetical protein